MPPSTPWEVDGGVAQLVLEIVEHVGDALKLF